jgi:hypothetical protein
MTDKWQSSPRQRGRATSTKLQLPDSNINLVLGPRRGLTPRLTGQLIISFIVTLTLIWIACQKSQDIFKLTNFCHIAMRVKAYKAQTGLMWCGGSHLHKECPEKGNAATQPSNYQGCSHTREEMQTRKSQRVPKTATGRVFSSSHCTPGLPFAVVLYSNTPIAAASSTLGCTGLPCHPGGAPDTKSVSSGS